MIHTDTLHHRIQDARRRLEQAGIEPAEAAIDADVLARHALGGWERGQLLVRQHEGCPAGFAGVFEALVRRRERREPTGYIIGHREFWNLDFEVRPGVLVPRPETELLVEEALSRLSPGPRGRGPRIRQTRRRRHGPHRRRRHRVGLHRRRDRPLAPVREVLAIDASDAALAVARRNADRHDVAAPVRFVRRQICWPAPAGPFDAVVSNPPYVPAPDIAGLQPESPRPRTPAARSTGGADGLDVIRRLVPEAAAALRPGGWLLFEFGFGQADGVRAIIAAEPRLELVELRPDLAGIPRVAVARKRPASQRNPTNPESRIPNPGSDAYVLPLLPHRRRRTAGEVDPRRRRARRLPRHQPAGARPRADRARAATSAR